jgi:hypothetical protein
MHEIATFSTSRRYIKVQHKNYIVAELASLALLQPTTTYIDIGNNSMGN